MGNWKKQQDELKEARERDKLTKEMVAKYFLDLSKLIFTAIVLGGLTPMLTDVSMNIHWETVFVGLVSTFFFGLLGYRVLKYKKL